MKTCSKCNLEYPLDHFYKDSRYKDGRVNQCKSCRLQASNVWRDRNRERVRTLERNRRINRTPEQINKQQDNQRIRTIKRHGLTVEQYENILASQDYSCAICRSASPGGKGNWHIDHDHSHCDGSYSCGECVRGLLCHSCNSALGSFEDDPRILLSAIEYLENW